MKLQNSFTNCRHPRRDLQQTLMGASSGDATRLELVGVWKDHQQCPGKQFDKNFWVKLILKINYLKTKAEFLDFDSIPLRIFIPNSLISYSGGMCNSNHIESSQLAQF